MKEKIDKCILKSILIAVPIFIVLYCVYPYVIPHIITIEDANQSNIKKFERNKDLFNEIIDVCYEIRKQTLKSHIIFEDIPFIVQNKLKKRGITQLNANIYEDKNIVVEFYIENFWHKNILNNITLIYNSYRKNEICVENDNNLDARIANVCLGDGWFFEIDTDWL